MNRSAEDRVSIHVLVPVNGPSAKHSLTKDVPAEMRYRFFSVNKGGTAMTRPLHLYGCKGRFLFYQKGKGENHMCQNCTNTKELAKTYDPKGIEDRL